MRTLLSIIFALSLLTTSACDPKVRSEEDQEAIKSDSINPTEGAGEGEVPDEVIK